MDYSGNILTFSDDSFILTAFLRCFLRKIIDVYYHCWFLLLMRSTVTPYLAVTGCSIFSDFTYPRRLHLIRNGQTEKQNSSCLCLLLCLQDACLQCKVLSSVDKDIALPVCFNTLQFLYKRSTGRNCSSQLQFIIPRIYQASVITQKQLRELPQVNETAAVEIDVNLDGRSSVRAEPMNFHYYWGSLLSPVHSFLSISLPILTEQVKAVPHIEAVDAQIGEHCSAAAKHWFMAAVVSLAFPQQRLWFGFLLSYQKAAFQASWRFLPFTPDL